MFDDARRACARVALLSGVVVMPLGAANAALTVALQSHDEIEDVFDRELKASLEAIAGALRAEELDAARAAISVALESVLALDRARLDLVDDLRKLDAFTGAAGRPGQQLALRERWFAWCDAELEPHAELHLRASTALAQSRFEAGSLTAACELQTDAVARYERVAGPDDERTLNARLNLSKVLEAAGRVHEAHGAALIVTEARQRLLGAAHELTLDATSQLASTLHGLHDFERALALRQEVFARRRAALPRDHERVLGAMQGLAISAWSVGDFEGSHALEAAVLAERSKTLPPEDRRVLQIKSNLSISKSSLGDHAGALALREEVLRAFEELLPPGHHELQRVRHNLASELLVVGDVDGAIALQRQVLEAQERSSTADTMDILSSCSNLSHMYEQRGELQLAAEFAQRALAGFGRRLRADDAHLADLRAQCADLLLQRGCVEQARDEALQLLAQSVASLEPGGKHWVAAMTTLAHCERQLMRFEEARAHETAVLHALTTRRDAEPADFALSEMRLAMSEALLGNRARALELAQSSAVSLVQRVRHMAADPPRVARTRAAQTARMAETALFVETLLTDAGTDASALRARVFELLENLRTVSCLPAVDRQARATSGATLADLERVREDLAANSLAGPAAGESVDDWRARV
jgi:tetratricopeptide (TPR) repeat protein